MSVEERGGKHQLVGSNCLSLYIVSLSCSIDLLSIKRKNHRTHISVWTWYESIWNTCFTWGFSQDAHLSTIIWSTCFTWGFRQDAHLSTIIGHICLFQFFLGKNGQHPFVCTFDSPILIINQCKHRLDIGFGYVIFMLDPFYNVKETRRSVKKTIKAIYLKICF